MALGIAKDEPESIITLARAGSAADILVTIGGASVGEYDLVAAALKSEGLELDFWKIAMRPGKPLLFGRMGNQRVLGVPGNPVSALICAHVFLIPMLDKLLGLTEDSFIRSPRPSSARRLPPTGRASITCGRSRRGAKMGCGSSPPYPRRDSSLVAALARADCLIVRPPNAPALPEGRVGQDRAARSRLRGPKPESRDLLLLGCPGASPVCWALNSCGTQTEQINCS